ncbi:ABC transporter ATP-binding protein [Streptomyces sp. Y2F8-2]|uniref:ABC transporter ATP-binding protein n=1 Tax=Streptomyces sp. Y2F8-2 TaxID=2759675 RepID=UPI0019088904|nr:ABC transporter ATP-binding protein [Streptomyces sp. Y2F8-2]
MLLRPLRDTGGPLLVGFVLLKIAEAMVPAATAVTMALLVSRLGTSSSGEVFAVALGPLLAFGAVLLAGHVVDALAEPLRFVAEARMDGAHRARIARLAAGSPTIGALERPEVQKQIRLARADPDNWTERTPGQGALAQLGEFVRILGITASCLVLARYAWWLVPVVLLAAVAARSVGYRQGLAFIRLWLAGVPHGRRAHMWQEVLTQPAEAKEVRVFGFAEWGLQREQHHIHGMFDRAWAASVRDLNRQWGRLALTVLGLVAAYVPVALDAAHGTTTVAVETAVFAAGWSVFTALDGLDWRNRLGALPVLQAARKLDEELGAPAAPADAAPASRPKDAPLVRFEQVEFTYPGTERKVLDGLDLEIRPGELLAVVGLNGAGKSTLIKLLSSLYEPTAGRITADGTDIAELGPAEWHRRISVVFQDFVRYHLTLADNVTLGQADGTAPDLTRAEAAARDAGLDEVLGRLPHGWDTPVARSRTGGVDLSGGQWQQVVLARALYAVRSGARLLVLDEPTAHLDVRTEFDVFSRLTAHRGSGSVVLISHRLSTVRQADRIVVLDGGRITESGTHEELMALGGSYAEMFAIQAERFVAGFDDRIEDGELE